jgi:hypothetical protein
MRLARIALVVLVVFLSAGGCTSDPPSPLGTEFVDDGLIRPDSIQVVQDTVAVSGGDTTFAVSDFLFRSTSMELGRRDAIETWPVFRLDFSTAGADTLRTVRSASLSLTTVGGADTLRAVFFGLAERLEESDTLTTIELTDPIPDSTLTNVDRLMKAFPRTYSLPPGLVQDWIRGDAAHNGMAVVLTDTTSTMRLSFGSKENADSGVQPLLRVFFTTGDESVYRMSADGTFARDLTVTDHLRLSDGGARRVYVPIDLDLFDPETLVHEARLILHVVPESFVGEDFLLTLYAPPTSDIGNPEILTGTQVSSVLLGPDSEDLVISIRNILSTLISRGVDDPPLVLRYSVEGTSIRRVEFYSSDAPDSLKPALAFTYSTAPKFGGK